MLQLNNDTPFEAMFNIFPDEDAIDTLYVTIKATFTIGKKVEIAEKQQPVMMADEYWGEPGQSSLRYAAELHLAKPATDIVLIGEACTPDARTVPALDVLLAIAGKRKIIRVFGERCWSDGLTGLQITPPLPFERMPLIYENAFGGCHDPDPGKVPPLYEPRNPIGKGFKGKRSNKEFRGMRLPNLEDPAQLIKSPADQPLPNCFGYVASSWEPRKQFAGTYDENWQKKRAPYLPNDFQQQFLNAAHPDLICDGYLQGGEPVQMIHLSPAGPLTFYLPICEFDLSATIASNKKQLLPNLETVLLEPAENRCCLIWRAAIECDKKSLQIEQINLKILNVKR